MRALARRVSSNKLVLTGLQNPLDLCLDLALDREVVLVVALGSIVSLRLVVTQKFDASVLQRLVPGKVSLAGVFSDGGYNFLNDVLFDAELR